MIVIVITDMVMTVMIVIAPMILVMIMAFRVALIVPMIAVAFPSEGRYWKQQSSRYCENNRELANHWFLLSFFLLVSTAYWIGGM